MMAYSQDLRLRVVDAYERGVGNARELAELFQLSLRTVYYWLERKRQTGSVARSDCYGGRRPKLDEQGQEILRTLVEAKPDRTLVERRDELEASTGVRLDPSNVGRTLHRMGLSHKKNSGRQ